MGRVEGKVAFVTGAARGQGRSHCLRLAEEGADIIATDLCEPVEGVEYEMPTGKDLDETADLVRKTGRRVVAAKADVRDEAALKAVAEQGVAELGRLDIIVANAGIVNSGTWETLTAEQWRDAIDINLTGVWHTCRAGLAHLVRAGAGSVILTSSYAGLRGAPFLPAYVASKHGVVGLMRELSNELAQYNIRVNTVHPTGVSGTGMTADVLQGLLAENPKMGAAYMNALDVQTVDPIDISNAVLYLASDESRYVTGVTLPVDAGVTNL